MVTDEEGLGNGIIISAIKVGFGHTLNNAPDATGIQYVQCTYSNSPVDVIPERFRSKGTTTAKLVFNQLDSEAVETWSIVVELEIYTSP